MRVRVRWFFAGTRGSGYCVDGWCRGDGVVGRVDAGVLVLGIWGGGGGRKFVRRYEVEKRICVFYLEGG